MTHRPEGEVFLGIDVGTQGVRVAAIGADGCLHSQRKGAFAADPLGSVEQHPETWWSTLVPLLRAVASDLSARPQLRPVAVGVASTSGTVLPLDDGYEPLHPALMYGDARSREEAELCRQAADAAGSPVAYGSSYGLPKLLWFRAQRPDLAERVAFWCHAADFVVGRLSGVWGLTDPTNALKTGYDPVAGRWPGYLAESLDLPPAWFPAVVPSGTPVGPILPHVAAATGLPRDVAVTVGVTDGCASQFAAGAVAPGEWSTTLGTTMVVKGVTRSRVSDPRGRLYNHLHPDGWWMPGGASNTGAGWVARQYPRDGLARLDAEASAFTPTGLASYPLSGVGERFPFVAPDARGFEPEGIDQAAGFAARMEGLAYLERMAFELVEGLSGEPVLSVATTGGGSSSLLWLRIRAAVLGRPLIRPMHPEAAAGAAVVAASRSVFGSIADAGRAMVHPDLVVDPSTEGAYEEGYHRFVEALVARGYVTREEAG